MRAWILPLVLKIEVGAVVRNASSAIVLAAGLCFRGDFNVECAEAKATLEGILMAESYSISHVLRDLTVMLFGLLIFLGGCVS
ncbi:hypothetical protein Dsin_022295 [Dipteronia sinensis]|uniref:Uncharacterized protein n=1 Tax=Dipteronia sinensis TaxID=43782 RepID=A0AAE0DZM8_9ROSI|nr:hypothetical protein Dsin_022295 [Dipteronia sinensis]